MISINSSNLEKITPNLAKKWLHQNTFERQRNMRPHHRDALAKEIQSDRFIQGTQIHFVQCDQDRFLVNGQHTLSAVVKSGLAVTLSVLVSDADSMDEVAELYSRHDNHLSRSILDAIKARDIHKQIGMTLHQASQVASAVRFLHSGFRKSGGRVSRDDILSEINNWEEEGNAFLTAIEKGHLEASLMLKASVLSVALVTFRYDEELALKFWKQVSNDDGLSRGDPRKTLHEFIKMTRVKHGPLIHHTQVVTQPYTARAVATAWNAFHTGKNLVHIQVADHNLEIQIKGTPYNGQAAA